MRYFLLAIVAAIGLSACGHAPPPAAPTYAAPPPPNYLK
jgi:hypothetical protein